jgi:predicted permease
VERLASHPGIEGVSLALTTPFGGLRMANDIFFETGEPGAERGRMNLDMNVVGPGYFEAMGIGLVRGRTFTWQDREGAPGVTVVNEALAARLWPGANPIGRRLWFWNPHGKDRPLEVVGIVRNGRYMRAWRGGVQPFLFLPSSQMYHASLGVVVRAAPGAGLTLSAVRAEVRALAPGALVVQFQPVTAAMAGAIAQERMSAKLLSLFGLIALALAGIGIYGVVSLVVTARTREMGVRLALGASRSQIFGLVVRHGLGPVLAGTGLGTVVALGLARLIASLLFGVTPADPTTFVSVVGLLVAAGVIASWVPARRATRLDPVAALRAD